MNKHPKEKAVLWKKTPNYLSLFSPKEAALHCFLSFLALDALLFSAYVMLSANWPDMVLYRKAFWCLQAEALGCQFLYEWLLPYLDNKLGSKHYLLHKLLLSAISLIVGGLVLIRHFKTNAETLTQGYASIANLYLQEYNLHFPANLGVAGGNPEFIPNALAFSGFVVIFLFLLISYLSGRKLFWILLPASVWAALMYVVLTPSWGSLVLFCVGLFLVRETGETVGAIGKPLKGSHRNRYSFRAELLRGVSSLGILLAVLCFSNLIGSKPAARLLENSEKVIMAKDVLEQKIRVYGTNLTNLDFNFGSKEMNSKRDDFEGSEVATITSNRPIATDLYLKNYQSTIYKNGKWLRDGNHFESSCKAAGYDVTQMQKMLLQGIYPAEGDSKHAEYTVDYSKAFGNKMLLPYFLDSDSLETGIFDADTLLKKNVLTGKYSATALNYNVLKENSDVYPYGFGLPEMEPALTDEMWSWYDNYVKEQYLDTPDTIPSAIYLARNMNSNLYIGNVNDNSYRLNAALQVSSYLRNNYRYTLDMGEVPADADIIEYFLSSAHQGFCVHFASAGVMILRNMGIPARYCEGYIVFSGDFTTTADGNKTASIVDRNAHAWVEIYLNHVGWVPIEMTAGFGAPTAGISGQNSSQNIPLPTPAGDSTQNDSATENSSETDSVSESNSETASDTSEDAETSSENASDTEQNPSGNTDPENSSQSSPQPGDMILPDDIPEDADGVYIKVTDEDGNLVIYDHTHINADETPEDTTKSLPLGAILKVLLVTVVILITIGIIFLVISDRYRHYNAILSLEMKRHRYRKAVNRINRRIYRRLMFTGKCKSLHPTDREYVSALKEAYNDIAAEDWDIYLKTVQKASFSMEELTEEEAQLCYRIYKTLKERGQRK